MNRESVYAALFALGQQAAGFSQSARRLRHIEEMAPVEFPAFFQVQQAEGWKQPSGNLPPIGELSVEWWVYVYSADPNQSHAAMLNPLIDALTASLNLPPSPNPTGYQSLGGLVLAVRLDGRIDYADGALDDRGFARIPLTITLAG